MHEIHIATQKADAHEVRRLLSKDPSLVHARQSTREDRTPLHAACCASHPAYSEVARILIEAGADLEARNSDGETPLFLLVKSVEAGVASQSEGVLRALLAAGAKVNVTGPHHDWTPLHEAARRGNLRFVEILLEFGANPALKSNRNSTPRDAALAGDHEDVARVLCVAETKGPPNVKTHPARPGLPKANALGEFLKFFEQLPHAPKHLKFMIKLAIIMLAGSGWWAWRNLPAKWNWPLPLLILVLVVAAAALWVAGFFLGFWLRKEPLRITFPPYEQMGKGALPSLIAGVGCGAMTGILCLEVPPVKMAGFSFTGWLAVMGVTMFLFKLYAPITEKAVQMTRQPNIRTADAYRGMWVFPAAATLVLSLGLPLIGGTDLGVLGALAVTSGIATSVTLAGIASGFLP